MLERLLKYYLFNLTFLAEALAKKKNKAETKSIKTHVLFCRYMGAIGLKRIALNPKTKDQP